MRSTGKTDATAAKSMWGSRHADPGAPRVSVPAVGLGVSAEVGS